MTTENENIKDEELNEAELSDVKNSIASLCKKYLTGSFFDKLVDTSGIKIAKDILLGDLKNMIGRGTSGPAAKKFANAIQMAKNPMAVDTIMSNYMLKGDGMGSAIGYTESAEMIKGFREYLDEAKKGGCCGGKKKPSEEEIEEAIKVVEAEGYRVSRLEESKEEKSYVTEEEIENAKKLVESRGFKVREKSVNEKMSRIGKIRLLAQEKLRQTLIDLDKAEYDYWMNKDPVRMRERIELYAKRMIDDPTGLSEDYAQRILDSMYNSDNATSDLVGESSKESGKSVNESEEKKEVSQDLIDEARKVVEAEGYTVKDPEADKHVISKEEIEEAKKIVESRGYKVVNESEEEDYIFLEVPVEKLGFELGELEKLIELAMQDRKVPTFLRNKIELASSGASDGTVQVIVFDAEDEKDAKETLIKLIDIFLEDATGIEAEISEDLLDNYANLIDRAREV